MEICFWAKFRAISVTYVQREEIVNSGLGALGLNVLVHLTILGIIYAESMPWNQDTREQLGILRSHIPSAIDKQNAPEMSYPNLILMTSEDEDFYLSGYLSLVLTKKIFS